MRRLKLLPWRSLLTLASLTMLVVFLAELLFLTSMELPVIQRAASMLLRPPLGILLSLATPVGVGALSVYLGERWFPRLIFNKSVLWALVLCLIVTSLLKSQIFATMLTQFSQISLIGMVLGVFWKGRPYWRY
ncbi:hypothetical protein [Geitlerinema sp. PCC 9228]|uniref:hypothetical protein n=1 Tax=Geitlerinema sp. PCC 9228 TaxID=111611 RepID=UPI0008F9DCB9|nr:hypothetical protein [Geitlerinema sp. PCC 9228]